MKVEYTGNQRIDEQNWISFMIPAGLANSGYYSFPSLVQDIESRCVHKFFSLETSLLGR